MMAKRCRSCDWMERPVSSAVSRTAQSKGDSPVAISNLPPIGVQTPRLGCFARSIRSCSPASFSMKTNTLIL